MKKIVGVMGPGVQQATEANLALAEQIGRLIAERGWVLLCGGMFGTMEASAKGAKEAGGLTVGIGPTRDKSELNRYLDLPLLTSMHAGRNYMNVISSDALVFVTVGSPGTLSELAFAIQMGVPSVIIGGSEKLRAYIEECEAENVKFFEEIDGVGKFLDKTLQ